MTSLKSQTGFAALEKVRDGGTEIELN